MASLRSDESYDTVRGILDYRHQARHWRFAGPRGQPFAALGELDLSSVDGLIGPILDRSMVETLQKASIPFVSTSAALHDLDLPRVTNDFAAMGRMAGEHLLKRGFAQFGFVGLTGVWASQEMLANFREVVERDAGRPCHATDTPWVLTPARQTELREWLKGLRKPIGVMTFVDILGRALLELAADLGLRVPDDVAVLGMGNNRWGTELAEPPMSSIQPDERLVGYRAGKVLDDMMAGNPPPPPHLIPPIGVVTRRSTDVMVAVDPLVSRALQYVRDHCTEEITVGDLLEEVRVSQRSLEKRMKKAVGITPQAAITAARVERAKNLLVESDMTIGEVARACAFAYQQGFVVTFKRFTGLTPGQFRHQRKGGWAASLIVHDRAPAHQ